MKKIILFSLSIALSSFLVAQVNVKDKGTWPSSHAKPPSDQYNPNAKKAPYIPSNSKGEKGLGEKVLGTTTYDLQTNAAVQDRIMMNANGDISVVWTASEANNPFSDRGSGYAFYDGSTELWTQSPSYPRIETDRCGWPNILYDGNGGEILISHSTVTNSLRINTRSAIGTGTWSEKSISSSKLWWSRAVMGGNDGNTIHLIACTNPSADSTLYQNMSIALVYYRSQDAGQTWDIVDSILPGLDSSALGVGTVLSGDAYDIVADGNHVAFGIFARFNDVILMESNDNGNNWTKTIIENNPFKGYQDFKSNASDTIWYPLADGTGSIIFDNNGVAHLSYGRTNVTNSFSSGGFSFQAYNPDLDTTIHYRNSSPPYYGKSAYSIDANGDSALNFTKIAFYGAKSLPTYGDLAFGNDSLYFVWSGVSDTISSGIDPAVNMRQIYLMKSGDYGETWTEPLQLTVTEVQFSENVMPDIYDVVDDKIRVVFERDPYPSNFVNSIDYTPNATQYAQTSLSDNDIIYLEIDLSGAGIGIGIEENLSDMAEMGLYPNPSYGQIDLNVILYREMNVRVNVTNMSGQVVHNYNGKALTKGSNKLQMDLSHLEAGMYSVNIFGGGSKMNKKVIIK